MFSTQNFIVPLNNTDKVLKIRNQTGLVAHIIRDPTCTTKQEGLNIVIKQTAESNIITLDFASIEEATLGHIILRDNLVQLAINLGINNNSTLPLHINNNDWQDSVIDIISVIPGSPTNGDRYIAKTNLLGTTVYDLEHDTSSSITVPANSIIQYWDATTNGTTGSGWVVILPEIGMYTNVDNNLNNIYKWNGTNWVELNWFTSYDIKNEHPTITTQDGQYTGISPLVDMPSLSSLIEVKVNGVDVTIGDGCNELSFLSPSWAGLFATEYTFVTASGSTIDVIPPHNIKVGDSLILIDNVNIVCYDVTTVVGNVITITGTLTGPVTAILLVKGYGKIKQGDILLWFGSSAGYELDPTEDTITFKYLTHN